MRKSALAPMAIAAIAVLGWPVLAQPAPTTGDVWYSWTPKPDKLPTYGRNQPVTRLPAVLAKHKGQPRWSEQVILTKRYDTKWIQAQPGDKTVTQYYADDRIVWVVWAGQIRFTIEGQQPFVATKGFLVQVPQQVRYSMETIGSEPSLRFEVVHTGVPPMVAEGNPKPADPAGNHYMKISTQTRPDPYDAINRPYVDFFKDVVGADPVKGPAQSRVVSDEANLVNIIRGAGVPTPPASNRGHFHVGHDEFWFILEGKCDYLIEDVGLVTADMGDVVFVPPGRFHRASWAEGQTDTRLSFNVSPNLFHAFGEDAGGRQ
jgi:mannose-6-phosphate isomerase-like protein (cupin superfamily)